MDVPATRFYNDFLEQRRLGLNHRHNPRQSVHKHNLRRRLYRDMLRKSHIDSLIYARKSYNHPRVVEQNAGNGIYNLEFSPDESILGAACERKCIFLFDPITRKKFATMENAHEDCVNCVRFLDDRLFATCSDDTTVALWDARFLKKKLRSLRGHSNWVKNIEFSKKDNYLVTSGFDGAIYAWDINKYSERNDEATKIFYTNGLMRMRLTPSWDKMVISTITGYLMIVHDLSLDDLAKDLAGFKPNMYRVLQMSGNPLRVALNSTPLFHAKRNRVELVSDFQPGNAPDIVSSLQLHPQGWVAVSRNVSSDETTEWCCVHDIQTHPIDPNDDTPIGQKRRDADPPIETSSSDRSGLPRLAEFLRAVNPGEEGTVQHPDAILQRFMPSVAMVDLDRSSGSEPIAEFHIRNRSENNADNTERQERVDELLNLFNRITRRPRTPQQQDQPRNEAEPQPGPSGQQEGNDAANEESTADTSSDDDQNHGFLLIPPDAVNGSRPRVFYFGAPRSPRRKADETPLPDDAKIHYNTKRLTHYIQESNRGRGYIKEVSFSPDGLLLASPYSCGVRLLAFNENMDDLSNCAPANLGDPPKQLHVVGTIENCNKDNVLSTAFSSHQFTLVTGCQYGSIVWHHPFL